MIKLGVTFGGMSTENEVSVESAKYILKNLDKTKYDIKPIYIDKNGNWYKYIGKVTDLKMGEKIVNIQLIENVFNHLKSLDVVFPVLHGLYGEDGTIQGMIKLLKIPCVGCGILSSSIGMDKVYSKIIFEKAGIKQTKSQYIKKSGNNYIYIYSDFSEEIQDLNQICIKLEDNIKYPMFIKPSNSGSSIGVKKVKNRESLKEAIIDASKYDNKIIVEQEIKGKEVECAVLGNNEVIAGEIGEIKAADIFYSYDAKYNNKDSKTIIPAEITNKQKAEIQELAIKAFKAIDGKGLARVDFFIEEKTEKIYLNEINTMPGFTEISMYPKLMEAHGIKYRDILDKLIKLAQE